jgi:hypothetical protein
MDRSVQHGNDFLDRTVGTAYGPHRTHYRPVRTRRGDDSIGNLGRRLHLADRRLSTANCPAGAAVDVADRTDPVQVEAK